MKKILFTSNVIEVECEPRDLERDCVIYRLTFPNGKQYIGQTWRLLDIRIKAHINNAFNSNATDYDLKKSRAIRKYKKFKLDVLYQGFILNEQEIYFINYFDTIEKGYNSCKGGDNLLGFHHSEKSKRTMSKNKLGANNPKSKSIFMLDKNNQEIIKRFDAIADAARYLFGENLTREELNKRTVNITYCLQRPTCTAFGYFWKYA